MGEDFFLAQIHGGELHRSAFVLGAFQLATAVADALTGAPLPGLGSLAGAVGTQLRSSYLSTVVSNWKIWVLPQLVNFAFVPVFARVAFANAIALVWNVVLSVIANSPA